MKHKPSQVWKLYKVEGDKVERLRRSCPRCGPGTFMAEHKQKDGTIRYVCGRCMFVEWVKPKA